MFASKVNSHCPCYTIKYAVWIHNYLLEALAYVISNTHTLEKALQIWKLGANRTGGKEDPFL